MIDLNLYQKLIFESLKSDIYTTYDFVPSDAEMPFVIIEDLNIIKGDIRVGEIYKITQNIDIYSDYEGKKEINKISNDVVEKINNLYGKKIDQFSICDVRILVLSISKIIDENSIFYKTNMVAEFAVDNI